MWKIRERKKRKKADSVLKSEALDLIAFDFLTFVKLWLTIIQKKHLKFSAEDD